MKKPFRDQSGFNVVETIIIIAVIGLVGATGWYVVKNQGKKSTPDTPASSSNKTTSDSTTKQADKTAGWTSVVSGAGAFTIKIPDGWTVQNWKTRDYLSASSYSDITYTSGIKAIIKNNDAVAVDSGSVRHFSVTGNPIAQKDSIGYYYNETPQEFGAVSGILGKKYVHIYTEDVDGVHKGDKVYLYRFEGVKTLITVNYYVLNGETDQSTLVEQTIKTLSFQ